MLGKSLADLQSNISISALNAVTGDINWVTGYTGFSSNFRELAGWYIALKIDASTIEGALEGATIVATYHGRDVTLDSDQIIIIRLADGEDTITFTANKEGYTEGRLTLDFSGLDKQEVNQSVYLTSETTGITISPMQFGNTKTISGQVPWDSTTNSNVMLLTAYPFFDVPSGTTYSLEGTYNGVGANIQITDGTFTTLDELDLTFSVPSEMIGLTGATFILMFEDPDSNRDYFTYDVTGLTLAPDPTPRVNVTSGTTGVTVTPATYNASKTATGQVPYDTTTSANPITFNFAYSGTWSGSYTMVVFYWDEYQNRNAITTLNFTDSDKPASVTFNATATNLAVAIGFAVTQNSEVINEPEVDTSALTLEPAPNPEVNITSNYSPVSITPATYSTTKTATGQVPYDTTTLKNILTVALTTSGTLPTGPYTIEVFALGDVMQQPIWYTTGASTIPQSIPIPLTSNEVGTGKYITVNFSGANDPEFIIVTIDTSALTLAPDPNLVGVQLTFDGAPEAVLSPSGYVYPGQTLYITGTFPNNFPVADILLSKPIPSGDTWTLQRKLSNGTYYTVSTMSNVGEGEDLHGYKNDAAIYVPNHTQQSGDLIRVVDQSDNVITYLTIDATGATYVPVSMFMETANANDIVGVQDSGDASELSLKASDFGNITATLNTSGGDPWTSISNSTSYTFKFNIAGTINNTPTGALNGHAITTSSTNSILFYITDVSSSAGNITSATVNSFAYDLSAYFIPVKFFANTTSKGNRLTDPVQVVTSPGFFVLMIPKTTFDAAATRTVKIRMKNGNSGSGYSYYQLDLTNVTIAT